jgi:hypothetical protein
VFTNNMPTDQNQCTFFAPPKPAQTPSAELYFINIAPLQTFELGKTLNIKSV